MDKKWCVYLHIVHADCGYDKYYVGITSQSVNRRWKNGYGYKNDSYFGRAIKKYKWENIEHIILENELSESEAKIKEQYYIKKYKSSNTNYGYNLTFGGEGTLGHNLSEDTKKKISIANSGTNSSWYGKHHSDSDKKKISENNKGKHIGKKSKLHKEVFQYSLDTGYFIKGYECVREAERETSIPHDRISRCCNGIIRSAGGYIWSYTKNSCVQQYNKYTGKSVNQYDKNHILINTFDSVSDIEEKLGYKSNNIYCCLSGKVNTSYGFIWEYA